MFGVRRFFRWSPSERGSSPPTEPRPTCLTWSEWCLDPFGRCVRRTSTEAPGEEGVRGDESSLCTHPLQGRYYFMTRGLVWYHWQLRKQFTVIETEKRPSLPTPSSPLGTTILYLSVCLPHSHTYSSPLCPDLWSGPQDSDSGRRTGTVIDRQWRDLESEEWIFCFRYFYVKERVSLSIPLSLNFWLAWNLNVL